MSRPPLRHGRRRAPPQGASYHIAHINVPDEASTTYFGYLAGPAIDNQYCDFRAYIDTTNRNMRGLYR